MTQGLCSSLEDTLARITPREEKYTVEAGHRLDGLTKPIGSLGRLEAIAAQMYTIARGDIRLPVRKSAYVFAADHGVTEEGVSLYPREVTAQMVYNFLAGGAAINVLARMHEASLTVVDTGVDAEFEDAPGLLRAKVRRGSRNMHREPAMTREEVDAALEAGFRLAASAKQKGEQLVAVGEMGIGNTTAASAIAAVLTGQSVAAVTGRGTGLDSAQKDHKQKIIEQSIELHFAGADRAPEPLEILRCVGGLELAAMTGFILGAAAEGMAIVCDGFISTASAAVACAVAPAVRGYLFAGHCSQEPGHSYLLEYIGIEPILSLGMRLGEGTGAVLAMPVIEASLRLFTEMATFASAGVSGAEK